MKTLSTTLSTMKSDKTLITTSSQLSDELTLYCIYSVENVPGQFSGPPECCYPDEQYVSEPRYYVNDLRVDYEALTDDMAELADILYKVNPFSRNAQSMLYDGKVIEIKREVLKN